MSAFDRQSASILDFRKKTLLLALFLVLVVLTMRLFYLQVIRHGHYNRLAITNRVQRERIIAPRGLIRARDGSKLVVNAPTYQISILPGMIHGRQERLSLACEWLDIDEQKLLEDLAEWRGRYADGREMPVVHAASKEQISVLRELRMQLPFFRLEMKPRRQYPEGKMAVHILGYVGEVTDEELDLEMISRLLWSAQGITGTKYGLRAAPSAGATYPLELLVATSRYLARYMPRDHSLVVMAEGDLRAQLAIASYGQACVEKAPALFIFAADVSRTSGRYGERADRYVHIEVGCASENLMLQAAALGLGSVAIGAYDDQEVSTALYLPKEWDVFLMVPVGKPVE